MILFPLLRPEAERRGEPPAPFPPAPRRSDPAHAPRSPAGAPRPALSAQHAARTPSRASSRRWPPAGIALGVAALILSLGGDLRLPERAAHRALGAHAADRGGAAARARTRRRPAPPSPRAWGALGADPGARRRLGGGRARSSRSSWSASTAGCPRSFPGAARKPEGLYVPATLAARWGLEQGQPLTVVSPRPTLDAASRPPAAPAQRAARWHLRGRPHAGGEGAGGAAAGGRREPARERRSGAWTWRRRTSTRRSGSRRGSGAAAAGGRGADLEGPRTGPCSSPCALEKVMMFVAVSLIVLVASLALVADLALMISSKRAEIGMLGTLGATPARCARLSCCWAGWSAGSGMLAGAISGWAAPGCSTITACWRCPEGLLSRLHSLPGAAAGPRRGVADDAWRWPSHRSFYAAQRGGGARPGGGTAKVRLQRSLPVSGVCPPKPHPLAPSPSYSAGEGERSPNQSRR